MTTTLPFWKSKTLSEMSPAEWESICDGCAKCCLTQLQNGQTEQLVFTDVACDLLDRGSCRCTDYENRSTRVPSCVTMSAENVREAVEFAPPSCAYRLLVEGKSLPNWHHLVSGETSTVHDHGYSVRYRVFFQKDVAEQELEDHIVDWPMRGAK